MTPILYEKDEIDFTSQGLGSLVEIYDVDVQEQRNGLLQLTASYPVSGVRYADISVGRIILAKPNQRDDVHAFRIVSTELDISGYALMIEADSITYDLTHNLVKHLNVYGNGQAFMAALKNAVVNPSIFAFYSDIATSSTTSLNYVNPMEAIMGTTGSFLQIWGGELKRENRRVAMFNRRGRDNVATFRLGKNIAGLKYSVDISSLVTRIIPTKSVQNDDQTTTTLEGTPVDSQYINNYEQIYTLPLEFTDDTIKTVADLNAAAKGWFTQSANTGRDKPTVTIDIDVLSLQDSSDYQDKFKNLESVSLTDTVTVYVPEYGVNVTAIVNELHYDPILDRVTKMTVGTAKQSFADSSRTQLSDLQDKIISVQNQADATAVSADGKSTNYYGSVEPSHPQEGDTWFWVNGDKSGIKVFVNGDWVDLVDSDTQEKIAAGVTEAVTQAKSHTATAIEQNNASQQEVMNDIAKAQADLAIKDGDFNNKAQTMADKALSDAKANTTTVAQETLNSAHNAINQAKSDITDAYKNADGVINKKVDDTATTIGNTISQNKIDSDGKISTAQSTATQALNEVTTKVSQTDYDKKTGDLTTAVSKAQQTADGVVTTVGNYQTSNDERIKAAESAISQNANDITLKVAKTDYDKKTGELSGQISEVSQTAGRISQTVSDVKTQVDGLSVGGRNLYTDTKNFDTASWNGSCFWTRATDSYNGLAVMQTTQDWNGLSQYVQVKKGDVLTYSAYARNTSGTGTSSIFWQLIGQTEGDYSAATVNPTGNAVTLTDSWQRVSGTTVVTSDGYLRPKLERTTGNTNTLQIAGIKVEKGSIATDWTPAPEDVDNKISAVSQTVDGISSIVSDPTTGLTKRIQTAEGILSTVKSTADGAMSKASQTANDITQEISDRKTGDNNTLQSSKDFTVSSISSSETGMKSLISQKADSVIVGTISDSVDQLKSITNWQQIAYDDLNYLQQTGNYLITQSNNTNFPPWVTAWVYIKVEAPRSDRVTQTIWKDLNATQSYVRTFDGTNWSVWSQQVTSSTLLSIFKDSWSLGTSVNNDIGRQITSGIVANSDSMSLISKNIVLDGNTTVTGDFYAKGGNFKNLNASNLTVGTLNGSQVNITNINASNIVSGAISGANLNINLNTGSVVFQKGRINSSDYTTDINIDQGYISTANGDTRAILKNGQLQLTSPNYYDLQTNPYLSIYNDPRTFDSTNTLMYSAVFSARDRVIIGNKDGIDSMFAFGDAYYLGQSSFYGLSSGRTIGKKIPTVVGGGATGVVLVGGSTYKNTIGGNDSPSIVVGWSQGGSTFSGNRVRINADYFHVGAVYNRTSSASSNVVVAADGAIVRSSSARKYKLDIKNDISIADSLKLIEVPLSTWVDKHEHEENGSNERYFGMIAEDLRDAGLEYLVQYGEDNEVEGINYDRVALLLIPLVKELKEHIEELESEGK
ncbi:phage tail spike protein [Leuconostoc mesenteroides]|uniref:phage tail spike protein n=1 Tax=Leuconostoc mesenteroides TaxID=1245 RepID=UPI002363135B|nr:phage tail spike protein [Leuconostoc mesenteroides]